MTTPTEPNDNDPKVLDFAAPSSPQDARSPADMPRLQVDTSMETQTRGRSSSQLSATADGSTIPSPALSFDSALRRRPTRSNTVRHYQSPHTIGRRAWEQPGAEPGVDTNKEPEDNYSNLVEACEITVVDFSDEGFDCAELSNDTLEGFLQDKPNDASRCRWINVNGLSFDVIRTLGNYHSLHRLAIEDLMNTRGRTKADWYSDQAFLLLTLSKLVRIPDDDSDSESESDDEEYTHHHARGPKKSQTFVDRVKGAFRPKTNDNNPARVDRSWVQPDQEKAYDLDGAGSSRVRMKGQHAAQIRTLQRYRGGPNIDRTIYMEQHSSLIRRKLAVSVEQVCIFLCKDNTVISFFEHSAPEVEEPIVKRLTTEDTILRRSADGSMICQAIIDAIIDLAIPVAAAYEDAMGELELGNRHPAKHNPAHHLPHQRPPRPQIRLHPQHLHPAHPYPQNNLLHHHLPPRTHVPGRRRRPLHHDHGLARPDAPRSRQPHRPHLQHDGRLPKRVDEDPHRRDHLLPPADVPRRLLWPEFRPLRRRPPQ